MIYYKYIIIYLILFSCLCADEPIALITKCMGNVKYKNFTKNKFKVQAKVNSPIYHDDGIKTEKKAFSKIMYLDNPSSISIYPETKISIMGEINGEFIDKGINMDQGIIKVNIAANEFGNTFTIVTPYSKVHCKECNFWLISNKKEGDHIYNIYSNGFVINKSSSKSIAFINHSTIISVKDKEIEKYHTLSDEYNFLESLMINANEQYEDSYVQKVINRKKRDEKKYSSNVVEIKLKNKFNIQKTIILTYTKQ